MFIFDVRLFEIVYLVTPIGEALLGCCYVNKLVQEKMKRKKHAEVALNILIKKKHSFCFLFREFQSTMTPSWLYCNLTCTKFSQKFLPERNFSILF